MRLRIQSRKINIIIILLILLLTCVCSVIYCKGSDIGGDEVFSIGFANNTEDFLFITPGVYEKYSEGGWLPASFLRNYYGVEKGEGFDFLSIYRNVRNDVHPPLYFMLLNAVSTLCGGNPSSLPGDIINTMIAVGISLVLILIGKEFFEDSLFSYLIPLLWIGSTGALRGIEYIRMYLALSALVLIEVYLAMLTMKAEKRRQFYILSGVFVFIGTLVHYYFYVAFFFIAAYMVIWHIKNKEYKNCIQYIAWLASFEMASICVWPYVFKHLLHSDRGEQALGNLASKDIGFYKEHLLGFLNTYNDNVFNGIGIHAIGSLLLLCLVCVGVTKLDKNGVEKSENKCFKANLGLIVVTTVGYFGVLFKISYSYRWTYISPTFALIDIMLVVLVAYFYNHLPKILAVITLIAAIAVSVYGISSLSYEGLKQASIRKEVYESKKNIFNSRQVFFVYDEWNPTIYNQNMYLMTADNICFVDSKEMDNVNWQSLIDHCPGNTSELVFMISDINHNADMEFERITELFENASTNCVWKDNFLIQLVYR